MVSIHFPGLIPIISNSPGINASSSVVSILTKTLVESELKFSLTILKLAKLEDRSNVTLSFPETDKEIVISIERTKIQVIFLSIMNIYLFLICMIDINLCNKFIFCCLLLKIKMP